MGEPDYNPSPWTPPTWLLVAAVVAIVGVTVCWAALDLLWSAGQFHKPQETPIKNYDQ